MSNIKTLTPKHVSPTTVLAELQSRLPEISEIYVIYKNRDGNYFESVCGDLAGLTFAIMILQKYAMDQLSNQE